MKLESGLAKTTRAGVQHAGDIPLVSEEMDLQEPDANTDRELAVTPDVLAIL